MRQPGPDPTPPGPPQSGHKNGRWLEVFACFVNHGGQSHTSTHVTQTDE